MSSPIYIICVILWEDVFFIDFVLRTLRSRVMSTEVKTKGHTSYKRNILMGLFFSMAGDYSLIWRVKLFIPGLLFFAIAQYFYIRAFGFKPMGGAAYMTSSSMLAGFCFLYLNAGITSLVLQSLVLMYCMLIFTMMWRSWIMMIASPSIGAACGVIGAISFVVSDFIIASDKFVATIPNAQIYVMLTYYLAQLLITASVAYYKPHPYKAEDKEVYTYKERLN